jgi:hypothetical protein
MSMIGVRGGMEDLRREMETHIFKPFEEGCVDVAGEAADIRRLRTPRATGEAQANVYLVKEGAQPPAAITQGPFAPRDGREQAKGVVGKWSNLQNGEIGGAAAHDSILEAGWSPQAPNGITPGAAIISGKYAAKVGRELEAGTR